MKEINIYTDGACADNQSKNNIGGWGAILEYSGHMKELHGGAVNTTNNRMEMTAVIEAFRALKSKDLILNVYSDSAYIVNCFNDKWYVNWKKNNWKNSQKKSVENKDLWEDLIALFEGFTKVNFYKVKGHLDTAKPSEIKKWHKKISEQQKRNLTDSEFSLMIKMNVHADELANKGIDEIRNNL
jgi:ribonuclease HI